MKPLSSVSFAGLVLLVGSACLHFCGVFTKAQYYDCALAGTILWFATVPFWMKRRLHKSEGTE